MSAEPRSPDPALPSAVIASPKPAPRAFAALGLPGFAPFVVTFMLVMMADNIEHVISYWMMFQKFHSNALGGFAMVSHWLPYLLFSVAVGGLNDRFDSRRLIQIGVGLFIIVSCGWGYFFLTDSLQVWQAMILLVLHGLSGVFWMTSSQMLLYDIVGPANLPSAVRLTATARYLGTFVGPGIGGGIMALFGPIAGMFINTAFYLPAMIWLLRAPYGRRFRGDAPPQRRAVRGLADIVQAIRDVRGVPVLVAMIVLSGGASFFVGNSYQAQMPAFAGDLGHGDRGDATYFLLLAADALGALTAGFVLELHGGLTPRARTAFGLAVLWAAALGSFALVGSYWAALVLLYFAGFFELSFSSMSQTLVQINAPNEVRGRVLGLFQMSSSGLRLFSGITVGIVGSFITVHASLAIAAGAFICALIGLWVVRPPREATA